MPTSPPGQVMACRSQHDPSPPKYAVKHVPHSSKQPLFLCLTRVTMFLGRGCVDAQEDLSRGMRVRAGVGVVASACPARCQDTGSQQGHAQSTLHACVLPVYFVLSDM